MERLAAAMGGKFVYAIVPDEPIEVLKHKQAIKNAVRLAALEPGFSQKSPDDQQDWLDDIAAEQLHDMRPDFWED